MMQLCTALCCAASASGAVSGPPCSACLLLRTPYRNIKRIGKQFTFGHQEDAHELYVHVSGSLVMQRTRACYAAHELFKHA